MNKEIGFIDIHCHLDICEDIAGCISRARQVGVKVIVTAGINSMTNRKTLRLASIYPEVRAALGIYPIDALQMSEEEIKNEVSFIEDNADKIIAIGEVGMDYKEDNEQHSLQRGIFSTFIKLAQRLDKPLVVHSRKAESECIEILEKEKAKKVIMHCFCGKFSLAQRIIDNKWILSIPTSVKYSEHFQKIIERAPIEQLLCETDSPFLHPDKLPNNESANVLESYKMIAKLKNLSLNEAKEKIYQNYLRLFV